MGGDDIIIMNDYCNGIAYATGCFANDAEEKYLVVRNLDKWYPEKIAEETGYTAYESTYNYIRDGKNQWVIKARNIHSLPKLTELQDANSFCRAYIELHGVIDLVKAKDKKGNCFQRPRLRIYGTLQIIKFINWVLPAREKKIQFIVNVVDGSYTGKTCAIYYQSKTEINDILDWLNGFPRNEKIWNKWQGLLKT